MEGSSDGGACLQEVTAIAFNQDASMFAIATVNNINLTSTTVGRLSGHNHLSSEVLLYHTDPLILASRIQPGFVVRSIALLERTNYLGLVPIQKYQQVLTKAPHCEGTLAQMSESGGFMSGFSAALSGNASQIPGKTTVFEPLPKTRRRHNELEHAYLYDAHAKEVVQKFSFKQPIGQCLLSYASGGKQQLRFVVVCRETVFIFSTISSGMAASFMTTSQNLNTRSSFSSKLQPPTMHKLSFETGPNDKQLGAIDLTGNTLICPASRSLVAQTQHGMALGVKAPAKYGVLKICSLNSEDRQVKTLVAHKRELAYCALDQGGAKCATAGILGTLVRVWSTTSCDLLHELRRGTDPANIFGFSFASLGVINSGKVLAGGSDKGTVHIWKTSGDTTATNSSKKIEASLRSTSDNLVTDLAQGILGSQTERRSICAFQIGQDDASIVKILPNRPGPKQAGDKVSPAHHSSQERLRDADMGASYSAKHHHRHHQGGSSSTTTSSNLCAIVVTKGGHYYKYHVDVTRAVTGKLVKENLLEHTFNVTFS